MTVNLAIWIGIDYDDGVAGCTQHTSPVSVTVSADEHSTFVQIMGEPAEYELLASMLMKAARLKRKTDRGLQMTEAAE